MEMGSKSVEYLIEASSGAHFSGFHMDGMQARNSQAGQATTLVNENVHKQPFVIGVAGGATSGKTTVCDMIIEQLHDQRVVLVNQEVGVYAKSLELREDGNDAWIFDIDETLLSNLPYYSEHGLRYIKMMFELYTEATFTYGDQTIIK